MKRDLYIDYTKAIATISVVFIHTVFWSGQLYLPKEIRTLSLLVDVPIFFILSGLTSSGNIEKTFKRLLKLQITYMIFTTGLFILDSCLKTILLHFHEPSLTAFYQSKAGQIFSSLQNPSLWHLQTLGNWWLHNYEPCQTMPVVMGSFWYLKTYFIVSVFGVLAISFFSKHLLWILGICAALTFYFNFVDFPTGQVSYICFYLSLFLIGYLCKGKKMPQKWVFVLISLTLAAIIWMFWFYGTDLFLHINKLKFPVQLPYVIWSLPSIIFILFAYNRSKPNKENLMSKSGKDAIFFYFAQGISSSILYFVVLLFPANTNCFVMLTLCFFSNLLLAFFLANLLKKADQMGWKLLKWIRIKTQYSL